MRTEVHLQLVFVDEQPDTDKIADVLFDYFEPHTISAKVEEFQDDEN